MLVMENDAAVKVVCAICGGPILPGQPYIKDEGDPIHSESGDCDPEEGWNPHMDTE
jgi:hypothetical protein